MLWVVMGAWAAIVAYLTSIESKKRRERIAIWRQAGRAAGDALGPPRVERPLVGR
mgnify:CR=1 FL=1